MGGPGHLRHHRRHQPGDRRGLRPGPRGGTGRHGCGRGGRTDRVRLGRVVLDVAQRPGRRDRPAVRIAPGASSRHRRVHHLGERVTRGMVADGSGLRVDHGARRLCRHHQELPVGRAPPGCPLARRGASGAGRRRRRHHPVERAVVHHRAEARTGAGDGLHDRPEGGTEHAARPLLPGRSGAGGGHPRRASSTSSPPTARPASTSSVTPTSTR